VEVEGSISASHSFIHRHGWPVSERVIDMVKYRDGVLAVGEWGSLVDSRLQVMWGAT
jgi:hypothetical protein